MPFALNQDTPPLYKKPALDGAKKLNQLRKTEHLKVLNVASLHHPGSQACNEWEMNRFYRLVMDSPRDVDACITSFAGKVGRAVRRYVPGYFQHSLLPSSDITYYQTMLRSVMALREMAGELDEASFSELRSAMDDKLGRKLTGKDVQDKLGAAADELQRLSTDSDVIAYLGRKEEIDGQRLSYAHR